MHTKAILLLKPFGCQRARFRSQPRLTWVATDRAHSLADEGNTNIAHTDFLLQLLHEAESLIILSMVKMVQVERLEKENQITEKLEEY